MKITLVSPYDDDIRAFGLRTLSSCLKNKGHDVKMLFVTEDLTQEILENISKMCSDSKLVGISLTTDKFNKSKQITRKIRKLKIPVLWGGIHPTIAPEECIEQADIICMGEAEETIMELADYIKKDKDYSRIPGLWTKNRKNDTKPLIQDLDSIPFQDYSCENHYIIDHEGIQKITKETMTSHRYTNGVYSAMTTRGCPYSCTYCCNNAFNKLYKGQRIVRKRSIGNIMNELSEIKAMFPGMKKIKLGDDLFLGAYTTEEIGRFIMEYKKKINLPLMVMGATPVTVTKDKLALLVSAKMNVIRMGIQTGSENIKKLYKRPQPNKKVIEASKIINSFPEITSVLYDVIVDNPWETERDIIDTIKLVSELPTPYILQMFSLTFFPGTELYEKAKTENIQCDYEKFYHECKKTYLNKILFLIGDYAKHNYRIPKPFISFLTSQKARRIKLNFILYYILKVGTLPFRTGRIKHLMLEALSDLRTGNISRIRGYMKSFNPKKNFIRWKRDSGD